MSLTLCDTADVAEYHPSDELRESFEEFKDAQTRYERALERFYRAVADELEARNRPADVGKFLGFHPGHVRRIARRYDVAPLVDVEPPKRRRRDPGHDS